MTKYSNDCIGLVVEDMAQDFVEVSTTGTVHRGSEEWLRRLRNCQESSVDNRSAEMLKYAKGEAARWFENWLACTREKKTEYQRRQKAEHELGELKRAILDEDERYLAMMEKFNDRR